MYISWINKSALILLMHGANMKIRSGVNRQICVTFRCDHTGGGGWRGFRRSSELSLYISGNDRMQEFIEHSSLEVVCTQTNCWRSSLSISA